MSLFKSRIERAREETRRRQAAAADPATSAWVSANAGTGKTHVLTMRVLRLLLAGTLPERVLALTYTKAAAAEMAKRVFARLAAWVTAGERELASELGELCGRAPTPAEMERARQLFAIAIETPGGLKVQTIHAFCERLLQRFPIEAGVPPGFAILDEHERRQLLAEAMEEMLAAAAADKAGPLWAAVERAVPYAVDDRLEEFLGQALEMTRGGLADLREEDLARMERDLRTACGVREGATGESLAQEMYGVFSEDMLPVLVDALRAGGDTDRKQAERLEAAAVAASAAGRARALEPFFFTGQKPRKNPVTKAVSSGRPHLAQLVAQAQARFAALHREQRGLAVVEATLALLRLARDVHGRYVAAKARRAALDFDDLVAAAARLLSVSEAVAWVLYKLDGGLEHILVDEAQDTSPVQWQVIRALAAEFFAGAGASEEARTLFAVGDEKQSIYGFQGAAPAMFAATGADLERRAREARRRFARVPLTLSFRAVEPLLAAVDRIFASPERTPGVGAEGGVQHAAERAGHAGLLEIWPLEKQAAPEPAEAWSPLEETSAAPSHVRLARRIAATIDGWLRNGEMLASEGRPIRAGDILILVRKRQPFAPAVISELKARDIEVAGADRLVLTEQIAVQDLVALGRFVVLPEDDLALAEVLKSPLLGLDDADLLKLAPGRHGSLWQALLANAEGDARHAAAAAALQRWRARAETLAPFEFYQSLLDGEGMRARMLARLGLEAADAIDELLNLALAYEEGAPPSLQGFLGWLAQETREVKRDMEQGRDQVRVMTVHGAKGLEAPVVFLPDTCSTRSGRWPGSLLEGEGVPFLWPVKGAGDVPALERAKAAIAAAEREERNRLLYVALTRARDRLYVAGFEGRQAAPADCWYRLIEEGLAGMLEEAETADGMRVRRLASAQRAKPGPSTAQSAGAAGALPLPDWARRPAPPEPLVRVPLAPSRLAPLEQEEAGERPARGRPAEPPALPPAVLAEDARFLRGILTHALLEHLPGLPAGRWETEAEALVARRAAHLPADVRSSIVGETLAVLRDPRFAALFGPDSRAEVAISADIADPQGRGPALRVAGKIDRLVREGDTVRIVDYKTNRPPPTDPARVPEAYLLQLAAYRLAVRRIFPRAVVRAALLWTVGPAIMEIPAAALDASERRLWELGAAPEAPV